MSVLCSTLLSQVNSRAHEACRLVSLVTYDTSAESVHSLARLRTFSQEFKCIAQQFDCVRHVISGV